MFTARYGLIFKVRVCRLRHNDATSIWHWVVSDGTHKSVLNYRGCSKEWSHSDNVPVISYEGLSKNTINIRLFFVVMWM